MEERVEANRARAEELSDGNRGGNEENREGNDSQRQNGDARDNARNGELSEDDDAEQPRGILDRVRGFFGGNRNQSQDRATDDAEDRDNDAAERAAEARERAREEAEDNDEDDAEN